MTTCVRKSSRSLTHSDPLTIWVRPNESSPCPETTTVTKLCAELGSRASPALFDELPLLLEKYPSDTTVLIKLLAGTHGTPGQTYTWDRSLQFQGDGPDVTTVLGIHTILTSVATRLSIVKIIDTTIDAYDLPPRSIGATATVAALTAGPSTQLSLVNTVVRGPDTSPVISATDAIVLLKDTSIKQLFTGPPPLASRRSNENSLSAIALKATLASSASRQSLITIPWYFDNCTITAPNGISVTTKDGSVVDVKYNNVDINVGGDGTAISASIAGKYTETASNLNITETLVQTGRTSVGDTPVVSIQILGTGTAKRQGTGMSLTATRSSSLIQLMVADSATDSYTGSGNRASNNGPGGIFSQTATDSATSLQNERDTAYDIPEGTARSVNTSGSSSTSVTLSNCTHVTGSGGAIAATTIDTASTRLSYINGEVIGDGTSPLVATNTAGAGSTSFLASDIKLTTSGSPRAVSTSPAITHTTADEGTTRVHMTNTVQNLSGDGTQLIVGDAATLAHTENGTTSNVGGTHLNIVQTDASRIDVTSTNSTFSVATVLNLDTTGATTGGIADVLINSVEGRGTDPSASIVNVAGGGGAVTTRVNNSFLSQVPAPPSLSGAKSTDKPVLMMEGPPPPPSPTPIPPTPAPTIIVNGSNVTNPNGPAIITCNTATAINSSTLSSSSSTGTVRHMGCDPTHPLVIQTSRITNTMTGPGGSAAVQVTSMDATQTVPTNILASAASNAGSNPTVMLDGPGNHNISLGTTSIQNKNPKVPNIGTEIPDNNIINTSGSNKLSNGDVAPTVNIITQPNILQKV